MTRTLLTLVIFVSSSLIVNAQFKKNDILLGGQLSYNHNSSYNSYSNAIPQTNDYESNSGTITISAGKAIKENTVFGLNLSYSPYTSSNYPSLNGDIILKYRNNGYSAGVFYRKYKGLGKEFFLFGEASAMYGWSNTSGKDSNGKEYISGSSSTIVASLYPGIAYRVSKHLFLELSIPNLISIGYTKSNMSNQEGNLSQLNKNEQFSVNTSLSSYSLGSLGIGVRLIL